MLEIILYILSVSYLTHIFLLSNEIGPFEYGRGMILIDGSAEFRPINAFDRIRRIFGAFSVSGDIWEESENALFRCPYCLSFWINLAGLPFLFFVTKDAHYISIYIFLVFSVPMIAGKLNE